MKSKSMWYNRLMAYNVKYNWLTFVNNPLVRKEWGILCLKEFSFYEVATNASSEKYAIRHGEYVSPTTLKNRRIRFLFDIIADSEEERRTLLNKVQRAFAPESNPSPFNKNLRKKLSFMDVAGNVRECNCQIYQWIQLSDFANEKWVWISAELITDSAYMKSRKEYHQEITNTLSWIKLQSKLPFQRTYYRDIENESAMEIPLTIAMRINDNDSEKYPYNKIKVIFRNEDKEMRTLHIESVNELWLQIGDIITIDSENRRCYWENSEWKHDITGLVTVGSERPVLQSGNNQIWIDVWVWDEVITADVKRNKVF